ncbi:CoA-binding protein [Niveibacterium terrae]|uniref:CoA-binding protein n=1 Tax=Niveibacterium terrae TaxID=3373598 RepID=UPI003A90CE2E
MENVVVIGASAKPERYSNKAIRMLAEYGHTPIPVAPREEEIEGLKTYTRLPDITAKVDTVTMYVGAARQDELIAGIIGLAPKRVIFNPGTENPDAYPRLNAAGIETLEACTLVLLRSHQF